MEDEVKRRLARLFPESEQRYGCCERKLAYATLGQALAVKERRESHVPGLSLQIYPCEYAAHFHLSSHAPTAAQRVRLQERQEMIFQGMVAEREACDRQWDTLLDQAEDLGRAIRQRSRQISRMLPSLSQITASYEAQRDDWVRLADVFEQLSDVKCRLDQLMIQAEVSLAHPGGPSLAWHQTLIERLSQRQAQAEAEYEEDAAFIRGALERLDVDHADNLARARAYLDTHYRLPFQGRGRGPERTRS
jgi:hypothetical protein